MIALAAVIAATTYATSAHAGVSFQVSIGWPAPVYVEPVYAPVCRPPVIVAPPPRVVCSPPVVVHTPYRPVCAPVRVYPGHGWRYGSHDRDYERPSHGPSPHGHDRH
jgi:hypothetical protein